MLRRLVLAIAACGLVACGDGGLSRFDGEDVPPPPPLGQADRIRIVGSSTVSPFSTTVAEHFGASTRFSTPIVETTGTGGGFEAFCQGVGPNQPSISNASRSIKPSEFDLCAGNGVTEIVRIKIGYDGIVLGNAKEGPVFELTKRDIYLALAAELPDGDGGWQDNPNDRWSDISPNLPDAEILVYGPPPTSGTRDAFVEIAMEGGAEEVPQLAALMASDGDAFDDRAHTLRTDGAWIDAGENDTQIIQTLIKNPNAMGVLGFSFMEQNGDRVKAASVGGIDPTFEAIATDEYKVSRSMYFYVKKQNVPLVPGLIEFIDAFTTEDSWGPTGFLSEKGLIPLTPQERANVRQQALDLETISGAS
ncbi:MAG: substrate-binding domain-containing protein [Pseudomonadota bacterium]